MHDNISNNIMTLIIIRDIISTNVHFYFLGRCHAPAEINVQNLKTKRRCPNDLQQWENVVKIVLESGDFVSCRVPLEISRFFS